MSYLVIFSGYAYVLGTFESLLESMWLKSKMTNTVKSWLIWLSAVKVVVFLLYCYIGNVHDDMPSLPGSFF